MKAIILSFLFLSTMAQAEMKFSRACERGETLTIAAVGDVLLHSPLQVQAYNSPILHQSLWSGVQGLLQEADLAYANLEGPVANGIAKGGKVSKDPGMEYDDYVYSGYPTFNYHNSLIPELKRGGFDIVSTANNHAMDRGSIGVDKTIEALQENALPFSGTRTKLQSTIDNFSWSVVTKKDGWNIAWLACTFSTNGLSDKHNQVLDCFQDAGAIENEIKTLAQNPQIQAVILTPHWGEAEYSQQVEKSQRTLAKRFFEAGATAILGNHPHVTKPWEKYITSDGRETFVIYSIGNFVSAQGALAKRTSAIVYLGLTKDGNSKAWINGVAYVPTYMFSRPYEVVAVDRSSRAPKESVTLLKSLLGSDRLVSSHEKISTNFECN